MTSIELYTCSSHEFLYFSLSHVYAYPRIANDFQVLFVLHGVQFIYAVTIKGFFVFHSLLPMNIFQPNGTHFIILVLFFLSNTFQFISDPFLNSFTTTLEECLVLFCLISAIEYTASDLQLAPP